ncbi:MAG: aminotransferase class V-fold PLP-dependent enzyme [Lentisphaeria bacterium]|nr:aminotransferase class V-fold PLP-dependent enzyme [Lentisphaeria bacterium]
MIYLDNAAAALTDRETADHFARMLVECGANQEAGHKEGRRLRQLIADAEQRLSRALMEEGDLRVLWCGSGTEALNIFSTCVTPGKAVTSKLEHPALAAALKRSARSVHTFGCDRGTGKLVPETGDWDIAAFHLVQSETGIVQDPGELFSHTPGAVRFLDAVQAAGKIPLPRCADILAVSGNKFGAPGCAALLVDPLWDGAEDFCARAEKMRHEAYLAGRMIPAAILTCADVAEKRRSRMTETLRRTEELNGMLRAGCLKLGLRPTVPAENASPFILHLLAPGYQGAVLVRMLAEEGVIVASGSACASETKTPSPALTALGYSRTEAFSGLRISFGFDTSGEDVKILLSSLEKVLKKY